MPTETKFPPDLDTLRAGLFEGFRIHTADTEWGRVICGLLTQPTPPRQWQHLAETLVMTARFTDEWGALGSADEMRELATRLRRLPDLSEAGR